MADLFEGKMYCDKDQEWCPPQRRRNRVNTSWSHVNSPFLSRGAQFRSPQDLDWRQSFSEDINDESSSYGLRKKNSSFHKGKGCLSRGKDISPKSVDFAHARPRMAGKRRLQQTGVICRPFVPYTQTGHQSVTNGDEPWKEREHENVSVGPYGTEQEEGRQKFQKEISTSLSNRGDTGTYMADEHQQQTLRSGGISEGEGVEVRLPGGQRQEGETLGVDDSPRWSSDRGSPGSTGRGSDSLSTKVDRQSGSRSKPPAGSRLRSDFRLPRSPVRRAQRKLGREARLSRTSSFSVSSSGSISSGTLSCRRSEAKEMSVRHSSPRGRLTEKHIRNSHEFSENNVECRSRSISRKAGGIRSLAEERFATGSRRIPGRSTKESDDSIRSDLPRTRRRCNVLSKTPSEERSLSRHTVSEGNVRECTTKGCTQRRSPEVTGGPLEGSLRHLPRHVGNLECLRSDSAAATGLQTVGTDIRSRRQSLSPKNQDSRNSNSNGNLRRTCGESIRNYGRDDAPEFVRNFRRDTHRDTPRLPFRQSRRSRSSSLLSPASWRSRSLSARCSRSERSCLSGDKNSWVGKKAECGAFHGQKPWWKRNMWVGATRSRRDFNERDERDEGTADWRRNDDNGVDVRRHSRRRYCGYSYSRRQNYDRKSPTYDSEEEYRRSRSREKARRKKQNETIQRYCRTSEGNYQVFWDGFQWVKKSDQKGSQLLYDQQMNATRRARRLHVGNLPLHIDDITEDNFKQHLWKLMKENWACKDPAVCPILHVWFARDRGGNYGFMEMASVEEAHAALRLDGLLWHGVPIRINRPTEWKNSIYDGTALGTLAGASGLALAESLAAAAQQAAATGNNSGLLSLFASLPEDQRAAAIEVVGRQLIAQRTVHLPFDLVHAQIQAEILRGAPSRVVHVACPAATTLESDADYDEILNDILSECNKHGHALAALIVTPHLEDCLPSTSAGDVYLEYATCIQADNIILTFAGRMFDGKPLQLQRFNELAWRQSFQKHAKHLFAHVLSETIESHKKKSDTAADIFTATTRGEQKGLDDEEGTLADSDITRTAVQNDEVLVAAAAAAAAAGAEDCESIAAACMAGAAAAVRLLGQTTSGAKINLPRDLPPISGIAGHYTERLCSIAKGTGVDENAAIRGETAEPSLLEGTAPAREQEKTGETTCACDSISTTCSL